MLDPGSARDGLSGAQLAVLLAIIGLIIGITAASGDPIFAVAALLSPFYLLQTLYTLGAALERPAPLPNFKADTLAVPRYTILVPLYREVDVVTDLVAALSALRYPQDRLQVLFLLEEDDPDTRKALEQGQLRQGFEIVLVPPGGPRTKPNALNHGLAMASGEFVTVYDAEDLPDPAQILDAAMLFAILPTDVVCLQARLAIDNASDGWLPLMMTIEYAGLFDATKCGFAAMAMPVALGGTSNHFRVDTLKSLGGWDAWNVAEDADIGLRIARSGGRVADLPSVTREEAPHRFRAWFAQRRRWHKGFLQTMITHTRKTRDAIAAAGIVGWAGGMVQVAGSLLGALFYPLFAGHFLWLLASGDLFDNVDLWSGTRNTLALWVALCGVMATTVPPLIGLKRRRAWHLAPWLVLMPVYQLLVSAATWVAIVDYIRAPSHWLKTEHGGADRTSAAAVRNRPEWRS